MLLFVLRRIRRSARNDQMVAGASVQHLRSRLCILHTLLLVSAYVGESCLGVSTSQQFPLTGGAGGAFNSSDESR